MCFFLGVCKFRARALIAMMAAAASQSVQCADADADVAKQHPERQMLRIPRDTALKLDHDATNDPWSGVMI